ncbi:group II intron reverse transcriptase/maturase [Shouchella lonarensis]|uniref:Group II intron reverse transcriptase/maturase n=1 Tax=Shouchella lonarensis TaxID=1464122 RepID=A0A1G6MY76_9BACI|nr:group II intron reverse transcriptase/maturase [Shouchella lonarensis]SDC59865.1 group II intron reverse transcriptase/maturase [Shouchella lonarensis]
MQNPEVVLINLSRQAHKKDYVHDRLYRILYNPQMYIKAFSNIYKNDGSATAGVDGQTASNFSEENTTKVISALKDECYQPAPARRVYIPKKNGKKRPLGIPAFYDRIVQEVCRMILEAIYEPNFHYSSHGFRPNKSCHTALKQIERALTGVNWFVEGDIKGFFDNIDHHVMINLLRKRIQDEKFIRLMWKFLKAGYTEDFRYNKTFSGTPQGGIISPILANVYLNELDRYVNDCLKKEFDLGSPKKQKVNPEYKRLDGKLQRTKKKITTCEDTENRQQLIEKYKIIRKEKLGTQVYSDSTDYKSLRYARYADDFIIGVHGSKEDCQEVKTKVKNFLSGKLKLELSEEKTLITHSSKPARFLGYDVTVNKSNSVSKDINGVKRRSHRGRIRLMVPKESIESFITNKKWVEDLNSENRKPKHRPFLTNLRDLEIVNTYNAEIRGMYNYYRLAENVSAKMGQLHYVMEYSCLKTLANKHKSSVAKIKNKYRHENGWGIWYKNKSGKAFCYFYNQGFKRNRTVAKADPDSIPSTQKYMGRTELEARISARKCEWCGKEDVPFEIHHVKRLKDLKGKEPWEQKMIARQRKTLVLCRDCHRKIAHGGKKAQKR